MILRGSQHNVHVRVKRHAPVARRDGRTWCAHNLTAGAVAGGVAVSKSAR